MKLLIVSDAWQPQVNGVVRTLTRTKEGLEARGWQVHVLGPSGRTMACPTYQEIRLTLKPFALIEQTLDVYKPDCIHIATEGPLGQAMRRVCRRKGWRFTTSFHTRFPEYLKARFAIPRRWTYQYLRAFHASSARVLVPTSSMQIELLQRRFTNVRVWGRGVDTDLFHPGRRRLLPYPGPIFLYVGRLAIEKNIEAFLSADLGGVGTKLVVGDGPERELLAARYPDAVFLGALFGENLAEIYASSDVFVFPSRTDTFGLVILEALASGLPVAAYPVPGPVDILEGSRVGVLSEDLARSALQALHVDREACREFAMQHSWERSLNQFESALHLLRPSRDFPSSGWRTQTVADFCPLPLAGT